MTTPAEDRPAIPPQPQASHPHVPDTAAAAGDESAGPGTGHGVDRSTGSGVNPGTDVGADLGTRDSAVPGTRDSAVPGTRDSAVPGTRDSAVPGTGDGMVPRRTERTFTRISAAWLGVWAGALVVILLIVFIAQNTAGVRIRFLWLDGVIPTALALLIAGVGGAVIAMAVASARIIQLRRMVHRQR
jgi:uncharacterized integral membrane protein